MDMLKLAAVALVILVLVAPDLSACTWKCNNLGTEFESCTNMSPWSADYSSCAARQQCMPCGDGQRCCVTYCDAEMCMQV